MGLLKELKGFGKDMTLYGMGEVLARIAGIITAPILTRIFVPAEYGIIALMQTSIGFIAILAGFNVLSGVFYYYYRQDTVEQRRTVLSTGLVASVTFAVLFSFLTWLSAPLLKELLLIRAEEIVETVTQDYTKYIRILSLGLFFSLVEINFRGLLRLIRQPIKYVSISVIQPFSTVVFVLWLVVHLDLGIEGALWAGVLGNIIMCCAGFLLVCKHYTLSFSLGSLSLILFYSLPQLPSVVLGWMLLQANRFFLNYFAPMSQQGLYSIAMQVCALFIMLTTAFRMAYDPFALSIMKREDSRYMYASFFKVFGIGMGLVGGFFALVARPFLQIITPPEYHASYSLVVILVAGFFYIGSNNVLGIGIGLSERTKYISYAQAVAFVVNVSLNIILIPRFWAWGAAVAFVGGAIAQSLAYYHFAQKFYPIPYSYWRIQVFIGVVFLLVAVQTYAVKDLGPVGSGMAAIAMVPFLLSVGWKLGLSVDDRERILVKFRPMLAKL